jgi:hypothetical protein
MCMPYKIRSELSKLNILGIYKPHISKTFSSYKVRIFSSCFYSYGAHVRS